MKKRIPALAAGILFVLSSAAFPGDLDLGLQLFEEEDWTACRRECMRVEADDPGDESSRLIGTLAAVRESGATADAESALSSLAAGAADSETRCLAAHELGRIKWAAGDTESAAALLKQAFLDTRSNDLFLRAGCTLHLLLQEDEALAADHAELVVQLKTCRDLWTWPLRKECMLEKPEKGPGLTSLPGRWIVAFYRTQIGPAIGSRCSLTPSCSEYFLQASRRHGLVGVALIGDRLVREPGVVNAAEVPVTVNGRTRFADPVEEHDGWMGR